MRYENSHSTNTNRQSLARRHGTILVGTHSSENHRHQPCIAWYKTNRVRRCDGQTTGRAPVGGGRRLPRQRISTRTASCTSTIPERRRRRRNRGREEGSRGVLLLHGGPIQRHAPAWGARSVP